VKGGGDCGKGSEDFSLTLPLQSVMNSFTALV
jgi:hypothetical protein